MTYDDIIKVAGLNHWFGGGDVRKQALFDINLTLKRGSPRARGRYGKILKPFAQITIKVRQVEEQA